MHIRLALLILFTLLLAGFQSAAYALVKGIYITQETAEDTHHIKYLIRRAKAAGINTFVIDLELPSEKYAENIKLVKDGGINYVARIIVFPNGGGLPEQVESQTYWEKKYRLVQTALDYGAQQIQLDYIRYTSKQRPSQQNAKNILKVVQWFKKQLEPSGVPLQADVFGIASFGESKYIGQNLRLMAESVDALCPMVYPSHFEPYREHAVTPYETVYHALRAINAQFKNKVLVKVYAYIELSNYRFPLSSDRRVAYIKAQIKAVHDAGIDGWFAWSAHNKYDYLFNILEANPSLGDDETQATNTITPTPFLEKTMLTTSLLGSFSDSGSGLCSARSEYF
jgi:hypothetical protein